MILFSYVIPEHHLRGRVTMPLGRSININVVPSFGHIVNVAEGDKNKLVTPPLCSSARSNSGDSKRAPSTSGPRTSIPPGTRPSVSARSWRSQSARNTSTSMLNVRGSAEDSDSDPSPIPYHHHNYPQPSNEPLLELVHHLLVQVADLQLRARPENFLLAAPQLPR